MVVGKHMHGAGAFGGVGVSNNQSYEGYEIRSGMSVQDLKQLTAQRQCMEYWELQARNSPRQESNNDWSASSPLQASLSSSPGSTSSMLSASSSSSDSPPRGRFAPATYQLATYHQQQHSAHRYGGYGRQSPCSLADKMFVTYGGQIVSFMEGVVNAPQIDCLPDMLAPL